METVLPYSKEGGPPPIAPRPTQWLDAILGSWKRAVVGMPHKTACHRSAFSVAQNILVLLPIPLTSS